MESEMIYTDKRRIDDKRRGGEILEIIGTDIEEMKGNTQGVFWNIFQRGALGKNARERNAIHVSHGVIGVLSVFICIFNNVQLKVLLGSSADSILEGKRKQLS